MTTTNEKKDEFRPRKLVPVGESIIVHLSGKAPTPKTRKFNGEDITEVTFWLGIADKNYPDLVGQYNPFITRSWISPQRTVETADGPKTVQPSKLYKTLAALLGEEKAQAFAYHDAALNPDDPDANHDKTIPAAEWKALRGFYVATFKEPRKDKETGKPVEADNGGIFWQEVSELKPLKAARSFNDEQLQANIIWPPPKQEQPAAGQSTPPPKQEERPTPPPPALPKAGGLGLPAKPGSQPVPPPKEPDPQPFTRTFGDRAAMIGELRTICKAKPDFATLKDDYLKLKGAELVSELPDDAIKHLLVLEWLEQHRVKGGVVSATINGKLINSHKKLHELEPEKAISLLATCDHEAVNGDPF